MKKNNKESRYERTEKNRKTIEYKQHGEGLFLFKNRSSVASLDLPKKSFDGKKWVGPNETWKGDSYFLKMIPREAVLVETIISPDNNLKENKMEEKLLLDQPDQVTQIGKVEHVVADDKKPINEDNEVKEESTTKETLLTEDPLAGVTIIRD
jgi:hypothetical protein